MSYFEKHSELYHAFNLFYAIDISFINLGQQRGRIFVRGEEK